MTFASGTKLGPYEVVGLIGAGGMREIYLAKDVCSDGAVALKVLPKELKVKKGENASSARPGCSRA
jgi:serine/threonine protein kinase